MLAFIAFILTAMACHKIGMAKVISISPPPDRYL
jgi:hypothetical protein